MWVSKGKVIWHPPLQKEYKTVPHLHPFPRGEKQKKQKKQLKNKDMPHLVIKDALKIC